MKDANTRSAHSNDTIQMPDIIKRNDAEISSKNRQGFTGWFSSRPTIITPFLNWAGITKNQKEMAQAINMQIKDIMSRNVEMVSPETLLHDVAKKMQQKDCGSILVSSDDRLVGVITDRDLALRCVAQSHDPDQTTASQVMTKEILYCRDTDEMEDVAKNMARNKVRRLPVLDSDKKLVGIISLGDLSLHSTDQHYLICGKTLGDICLRPVQVV